MTERRCDLGGLAGLECISLVPEVRPGQTLPGRVSSTSAHVRYPETLKDGFPTAHAHAMAASNTIALMSTNPWSARPSIFVI